jgi:PKD repeat protein
VQVVVSASDAVAHGVLAYQVAFGDGSATHDVTPMLCTAAAAPQHRTWTATHTYGSRGAYTVSATVSANCTPDRATASVPVRVP